MRLRLLAVILIALVPAGAFGSEISHSSPTRLTDAAVLAGLPVHFNMSNAYPVHGSPRRTGGSDDGLELLELIGPPSNLRRVSIVVSFRDDEAVQKQLLLCLSGLLTVADPTWKGRNKWMATSTIKILAQGGLTDYKKTVDGFNFEMRNFPLAASKDLHQILLIVTPNH